MSVNVGDLSFGLWRRALYLLLFPGCWVSVCVCVHTGGDTHFHCAQLLNTPPSSRTHTYLPYPLSQPLSPSILSFPSFISTSASQEHGCVCVYVWGCLYVCLGKLHHIGRGMGGGVHLIDVLSLLISLIQHPLVCLCRKLLR
jgi:hypothetical protein